VAFFDPESESSLYAALRPYLENGDRIPKLSENQVAEILRIFNWDRAADETERLFQEVLQER